MLTTPLLLNSYNTGLPRQALLRCHQSLPALGLGFSHVVSGPEQRWQTREWCVIAWIGKIESICDFLPRNYTYFVKYTRSLFFAALGLVITRAFFFSLLLFLSTLCVRVRPHGVHRRERWCRKPISSRGVFGPTSVRRSPRAGKREKR